jgi:hypothetical protein
MNALGKHEALSPSRHSFREEINHAGIDEHRRVCSDQRLGKGSAFDEGVLGLRFVKDDGFALVLEAKGIMVRAAKMKEVTPAQFTILGWQVSDIEQVVRGLVARGVPSKFSDSSSRTN